MGLYHIVISLAQKKSLI